jgi:hypothetical protein
LQQETRTRTCILRRLDDKTVHCVLLPDAEETELEARANIAAIATLIPAGTRTHCLIDFRGARSMTRDARVFYSSEECARTVSAAALVVGSPLSRALGNFFTGLNKTKMPLKLFSSESEAKAWLMTIE